MTNLPLRLIGVTLVVCAFTLGAGLHFGLGWAFTLGFGLLLLSHNTSTSNKS